MPYKSGVAVPELDAPYPTDDHLVRTRELMPEKAPMPLEPEKSLPAHSPFHESLMCDTSESTSASRQGRQFEGSALPASAPPNQMRPPNDEKQTSILRTRNLEWELQRSDYNPTIASQMRCELRP